MRTPGTSGPPLLTRLAEQEASWFFGHLGGQVPEGGEPITRAAAAQIDGWLRKIPAFHRGVLSLRYVQRSWPQRITEEFGELASVAVRLECALHPAVGISIEALERASVERLETAIQLCERSRARRGPAGRDWPMSRAEKGLARLLGRAHRHVKIAIRAFARARRYAPRLAPVTAR